MNWENVKLGDVCEVIAGQSPPSSTYNNMRDGLPFFQGKADFGNQFPKVRLWYNEPNKIAEPNDILLSVRAPVGPTNICNLQSCIGRGLAAIRSNGKTDSKFVYYYFKSIEKKLSKSGNGSTFSAITSGDVKNLQIPLPPLTTQQKIAAILDKADKLRRKDAQLLSLYDNLLQSIFYKMFGDPIKNEMGWEKSKVKNVLFNIDAGSSYGGEERSLKENELGVLKVSAVTWGFFKSNEFKAVDKKIINKKLIHPKKGDLLFSRANTRELVGATCVVDNNYSNLFLPDKLWRIDIDLSLCNQYYFHTLLSIPKFKERLTKTATGTNSSIHE